MVSDGRLWSDEECFKYANSRGAFIGQYDDWKNLPENAKHVALQNARDNDADYRTETTNVPPSIIQRENRWFVQLHFGNLTYEAPLGHWFLRQVFERVVIPAVLKRD